MDTINELRAELEAMRDACQGRDVIIKQQQSELMQLRGLAQRYSRTLLIAAELRELVNNPRALDASVKAYKEDWETTV